MLREEFLDDVKKIICQDRNAAYGEPEDSYRVIRDLWNAWLKEKITQSIGQSYTVDLISTADVADLMILFKVGRSMAVDKPDNWLDKAGYAGCGYEVAAKEKGWDTPRLSILTDGNINGVSYKTKNPMG